MGTQAGTQAYEAAGQPAALSPSVALRPVERRNSVTIRAILLGLVLCVIGSVSFVFTDNVIRGSTMSEDHTAIGVTALFFVLVLVGNGLARWIEKRTRRNPLLVGTALAAIGGAALYVAALAVYRLTDVDASGAAMSEGSVTLLRVLLAFLTFLWMIFALLTVSRLVEAAWSGGRWLSLNRAELLTIFAMLLMTTALVTSGLTMQLVPTIPAMDYYRATNHWSDSLIGQIPDWMRIGDEQASKAFFDGIQSMPGFEDPQPNRFGEPFLQSAYETWNSIRQIPWQAWQRPLLAWATFLLPLYAFMIASMVIIRRQWMDREILVYPLTRLPQEMARTEDESPKAPALGPLFRNSAMWLGFALPVVFSSLRAIHAYYAGFPEVKLEWQTQVMADQVTLWILPSFVAIGFTYLISTRISFSVWTFALAGLFIGGWLALRGYKSPEDLGYYGSAGNPLMYHLGMGALLTMAVLGLWSARRHLGAVLRKAFLGDASVDDSREIMSYRAAVIVCLLSAAVMLGWLIAIGMQWWVALFFWTVAMLVYYGLTRIVTEAGLAAVVPPGLAPAFTLSKLGASAMAPASVVGIGLQYPYAADVRTFVMASTANSLKLTQEIEHRRRRLFWALLLAVTITLVVSVGTAIYISYVYQGTSLEKWYYRDAPAIGLNYAKEMMRKQPDANIRGWVTSLAGVALMTLLMVAQRRFLRWPLHPIGLAIIGTWTMEKLWFSIFLAWLIKSLVLKYGGPRLYMRTVPFFLGMILGQAVIAGTWLLIDHITGVPGNALFSNAG